MTAAISSVVAVRPSGMSRASLASCSSVEPTRMLVSTAPGVTALTVTPVSAISRASALVKPRMAALADEYGTLPNTPPPRCADTEDMLTMRTRDGIEVDKSKITPYVYRHCYAQRHADAGVPIDVLAELLDHRSYSMTRDLGIEISCDRA